MSKRNMWRAGFVVIGAVLAAGGAQAAPCGVDRIDSRFAEAALLCGSMPARAPASAAAMPLTGAVEGPAVPAANLSTTNLSTTILPAPNLIEARDPVSVTMSMPTRRLLRAAEAVRHSGRAPTNALFVEMGRRYRIDPYLLASIVKAESGGRAGAVSNKGALGLMQVMPDTARGLGVSDPKRLLTDEALAIDTGARYLKTLQARFGNRLDLVLAAYNAGPGAVERAGRRIPVYRETQGYVGSILKHYSATRPKRPAGIR